MEQALWSYARLSRDDPPGVEKIPAQHRANRAEIARLGRECAGELHDDGISGEFDERWRPGLRALLESWRRGAAGGVVVRDLDRLARHADLHGYIFQTARQTGAQIISRLDDATDRHARRAKATAGEEYITRLRQVCTAKFAERAREGMYPGGQAVFGLRWDRDCDDSEALRLRIRRQPIPCRREIVPDEAARLLRAIDMVESGRSIRSAAASIGIAQQRLALILRNPAIAGAHAYGRTRTIPDTPLRTSRGTDPIIVWGAHPGIVSRSRWDRLQLRLDGLTANWRARPGRASVPLSGQMTCGVCGARVRIYCGPWAHGRRYRYARCEGPGRCVHAEVERWPRPILAALSSRLEEPDLATALLDAATRRVGTVGRPRSDSGRLDRAERVILDLASDGSIDAAEARRRLALIRSERESLAASQGHDRATAPLPSREDLQSSLLLAAHALRVGLATDAPLRPWLVRMLREVRVTGPKSAVLLPAWGGIIATSFDRSDSSAL
jgi:DNA invertase Pin-like site-specific DNA recombinase